MGNCIFGLCFWSSTVLCCLFSVISSSLFFHNKSCLRSSLLCLVTDASEAFLSTAQCPVGAVGAGGVQALHSRLHQALQWLGTTDYEAKQQRSSFHWTWNWCKDQSRSVQNTTWKRTVQGIKQMLFFLPCDIEMQTKPQVTEVNIQPDRSQDFTSRVLIPGWCQSHYISHMLFSLVPHYFHSQGDCALYHSSWSFLGVRWIFCM